MRRDRSPDSKDDDMKNNKKLKVDEMKVNEIDEMIKDAIIDLVNKRGCTKTC